MTERRFGDGLTHGRPVSSYQRDRFQPLRATTVSGDVDLPLFVQHPGDLADRHPGPDRDRVDGREGEPVRVRGRPLDDLAADRVRAVEDDDGDLRLRALLHHVRHRGEVGVEADAGVLQVDDDGVEPLEVLRRGAPLLPVEGDDGEPGRRVDGVGDLLVEGRGDAVLRGEEADELHAGGLRLLREEDRRGRPAVARHAGGVRQEGDALSLQRGEAGGLEDVDARADVERKGGRRPLLADTGTAGRAARWEIRSEARRRASGEASVTAAATTLASA